MTRLPPEPASRLATRTDIDTLSERIDTLSERIDVRFEAIDQRFDRMDQRFDRMDQRFERLDDRLHDLQDAMRDQMRFYTGTTVWAMTALTGMFAVVVALIT